MDDDIFIEKLFTVRVCHMIKSPISNEYGFNLKAKTNGKCHYIGRVDKDTPAHFSGLKSGDKIIEINNINIHCLNYDEIMEKINQGLILNQKLYKNELLLMVIDSQVEQHYGKTNDELISNKQDFSISYKTSENTSLNKNENISNTNEIRSTRVSNMEKFDKNKLNSNLIYTPINPNQIKYDQNNYLKNGEQDEEYQITFI
jgi:hypothetical protein